MTRHGPVLLALTVLAIAGWTYNVNYDTRAALDRLDELRARIAEERETLQVLRVEWAYLNAPDRLARLVGEHNERLGLVALTPEALGYVAAVPYPPDLPAEPAPAVAPEMLVAEAPAVPAPAAPETGTTAPQPAVSEAGDGREAETELAAAAAEKAETLGARPEPLTMQDAVALVLAEAGVIDGTAAGAPVVAASAPSGTPMPPVRPAVWVSR